MCGICGIVSTDPTERFDPRMIQRMRDTLAHRGPDDKGLYLGSGVALGHRRLSIVDLRPEGRQPMTNEDGRIQIVFNGEIYNFAEQRDWLIAKGHQFKSRTDTEVVIHLYEELGVECLARLRGMFAFAIWDERKRLLFLARDRLGKKPLVYSFDGRRLLFASEVKALLVCPTLTPTVDPQAIDYYVSLGYVPGPFSAFQGVRKLPPAHYLTFSQGKLELRRYWQVHYRPKLELSPDDACAQIIERLTDAIKVRLMGDVPLGAFLSGGLDSSAIVALMTTLSNARVKTFSIGFNEPAYDERRYALSVARQFGTEHHVFTVGPDATDILETLVWHFDEPFADPAALPTYFLSKFTRNHVTVALNGDAGDENFAGYPRYLLTLLSQRLHSVPSPLRRLVRSGAFQAHKVFRADSKIARHLQLIARTIQTDPRTGYARLMTHFDPEARDELYSIDFGSSVERYAAENLIAAAYERSDAQHVVDATLNVDLDLYLPYDLLAKVDITSMAFGLEARSPMVDHKFVEFVAQLPARFKIGGVTLKAIFKKALRGILPEQILTRKKMGFGVPLDLWFRGQLAELLGDTLLSRKSLERGYFQRRSVERLIADHVSGQTNHQYRLWNLLMLELWHRVFIDAPAAASDRQAS
jgi:asparagine synthase (glutamine-hydrolysing)